jgi:predicted nucleotidyltransferase
VDVSRPYSAAFSGLEGDVLFVLAGTTRPLTGREVAQMVKRGSTEGVRQALERLVEQGVVQREPAGRAFMHTLNREHIAAPAIELLAGAGGELLRRLREAFASWGPVPVHASLFGSAARGDGDTASDIDLFVIRPAGVDEDDDSWRAQVNQLADKVRAWTGNHTSVIEVAEEALPELLQERPPVVAELKADGIDLAGQPLRRLLRALA